MNYYIKQTDYGLKPYGLPAVEYTAIPYRPNSLDDLIRTYNIQKFTNQKDDDIFSERRKTCYLALDDILTQIRKRYEIYESNVRVLEYSKITLSENFYQWPQLHGFWPEGQKEMFAQQMNQLYQKQLEEKVNLWKDISKLKLMIPSTLKDYLSVKHNSDLYNGGGNF